MTKPICTVLLISYNHEEYIEKCIKSVLSQKTNYNYIIKIFDDCSTDKTQNIIKKYVQKYPQKIKPYINSKNLGAQKNIWKAYKSVTTKYCILTETDDYWCNDNKLQMQIDALENNPNCSFCSTNNLVKVIKDEYLTFKDNKPEIQNTIYKNNKVINFQYINKLDAGFLTHVSSRLIRTSTMDLSKLKNKESFLFDAAQYFYLLTKGDMYWIDEICSVYVKTGKGVCSSAMAGERVGKYLTAMAQLNEDTNYNIWEKIVQQINLVTNYWLYLEKQKRNNNG